MLLQQPMMHVLVLCSGYATFALQRSGKRCCMRVHVIVLCYIRPMLLFYVVCRACRDSNPSGPASTTANMSTVSEELRKRVQDLIDSANKTGAIVSTWEVIKAMLFEASLAWEQKCKPEYVATHMRNRSGEGVGAIQSHHHGHDITVQGWSWHKVADAVAVEYVDDAASLKFNNKLGEVSDDCFPPFRQPPAYQREPYKCVFEVGEVQLQVGVSNVGGCSWTAEP